MPMAAVVAEPVDELRSAAHATESGSRPRRRYEE
jgi:hypothetical protein